METSSARNEMVQIMRHLMHRSIMVEIKKREILTRYQANHKNQLHQSLCWRENLEKYHQYSL